MAIALAKPAALSGSINCSIFSEIVETIGSIETVETLKVITMVSLITELQLFKIYLNIDSYS